MGNKVQPETKFDKLKWLAVLILLALGLVVNYHLSDTPWSLRLAGWIVLVCVMLYIAAQTTKGMASWHFLKEARNEIRRVVSPNRQETMQTTGMVIVVVIVLALILWGVDTLLLYAISWFTGHGG